MPINRKLNMQKLLTVPRELVAEIEQFRARTQISSKSEAWRQLLRKGLRAAHEEQDIVKSAKNQQQQVAA